MGFLDVLKKMMPELVVNDYELTGAIYFENNYWKLHKKFGESPISGDIVENKGGFSKYKVMANGLPVGYFPQYQEHDLNFKGVKKTTVYLTPNEVGNLKGTIIIEQYK